MKNDATGRSLVGYLASTAAVAIAAAFGWLVFPRGELADVVMVFLLGVMLVASRFGYGPSIFAAALSVVAFDFFFVPPYFSLAVSDLRHVVTFAVMFLVAVVISHLTRRIREQADAALLREERSAALHALTRELSEAATREALRAETEQLRNALLSSVSHDLRTPLAVVTGAASTLLDPSGPTDEASRRELLSTIHEEAERLGRLVRNLLDMTRLDAGALKMMKELQPIEEVVGAALNRVEDRLLDREVKTELPDDLPLVPLDAILIEQVLINLLENATKYTPRGTAIVVAASAKDDMVEVVVADHGLGVPEEDRERVFDKFFRRGESERGGAGLGLTICRGIVTAHGGKIWLDSRLGGGAAFHFTLPLHPSAAKLTTPIEHGVATS